MSEVEPMKHKRGDRVTFRDEAGERVPGIVNGGVRRHNGDFYTIRPIRIAQRGKLKREEVSRSSVLVVGEMVEGVNR